MRGILLATVGLWGCDGGKDRTEDADDTGTADGTTPEDTGVDVTTPVHTGDTGTPVEPSTLSATCAPTANPIRFDCTVVVDPPQPVEIRFAPADGSGPERVHPSDEVTGEHDIGLYLMRADTDYQWTARTLEGSALGAAELTDALTTGPLPPDIAETHLTVTGASSVPYVGTHHPCDASATPVVYDTVTGEVVWYEELDPEGTLGFFDMLQFTEDHTVLGETGPSLVEVDLRGRDLLRLERNLDYDEYFHHDLFKRNGHVYAIYQDGGQPTLDGVAIFDATTGVEVANWRARDHLEIPGGAAGDWMHSNTVWVDEAGDMFISSWAQDSILKIAGDWTQPDFGQLIWALAGLGNAGFGDDFTVDYSPVPEEGFRDQHNVNFTADGRLLMLDNGHGRGLLLTVDQVALTARADAEFPANEWVCGPQGTAQAVPSGNVFVGCSGAELLEYDASGVQVWDGVAVCESARSSVIRWYPLEDW
jgi:hypothetical protein